MGPEDNPQDKPAEGQNSHQQLWEVYQAARQALEAKLPLPVSESDYRAKVREMEALLERDFAADPALRPADWTPLFPPEQPPKEEPTAD